MSDWPCNIHPPSILVTNYISPEFSNNPVFRLLFQTLPTTMAPSSLRNPVFVSALYKMRSLSYQPPPNPGLSRSANNPTTHVHTGVSIILVRRYRAILFPAETHIFSSSCRPSPHCAVQPCVSLSPSDVICTTTAAGVDNTNPRHTKTLLLLSIPH